MKDGGGGDKMNQEQLKSSNYREPENQGCIHCRFSVLRDHGHFCGKDTPHPADTFPEYIGHELYSVAMIKWMDETEVSDYGMCDKFEEMEIGGN